MFSKPAAKMPATTSSASVPPIVTVFSINTADEVLAVALVLRIVSAILIVPVLVTAFALSEILFTNSSAISPTATATDTAMHLSPAEP